MPNATAIVVDDANRVRSATVGADTETFTYDGLGRRTRTTTGFGTLVHFYSQAGQLLLWETPGNEVKTRQYTIYLGDRQIAHRFSSGPVYVHTDHLGSVLAKTSPIPVTLTFGSPHWEPWGAPAGGVFWGGLQYAGHYQDRTTALTYMQQRYYDPYAGRFLAVDPVAASPGSFNRYWYANNNPYKYIDPDGRWVCTSSGNECNALEDTINEANRALKNGRLNSEESKKLGNALSALGEKGDNRVRIEFTDQPNEGWAGKASFVRGKEPEKSYAELTINTAKFASPMSSGPSLGGAVVHEAAHSFDDFSRGRSVGSLDERRKTEVAAYTAEAVYYKAMDHVTGLKGLWTPFQGINDNAIYESAEKSIKISCSKAPGAASCN